MMLLTVNPAAPGGIKRDSQIAELLRAMADQIEQGDPARTITGDCGSLLVTRWDNLSDNQRPIRG